MLIRLSSRIPRLVCIAMMAVVTSIGPRVGRADSKSLAYLAEQLKSAPDFRVRTQAALALGAAASPDAVAPLCAGLEDPNESVRSAVAAAIGRLGRKEAIGCLERHSRESSPAVRAVIERSLASLRSSSLPSKPPLPRRDDTFYVAIGNITDKTGRSDGTVISLVQSAMQEKLLTMHGYAVAPQAESVGDARKVLQKYHLKGFMLQARVEPPKMNGGSLTMQVRVTFWSYPDRALLGEFTPKLTMSNVGAGDTESEDELIRMAIDKALESLAVVAATAN